MSVRTLKSLVIPLAVFAIFVGFWIGFSMYQRSKLALPSHIDTLAKFSAEMPRPERVVAFDKDGYLYVEVVGRPSLFPAIPVPSGPPVYIFDSAGHISYWTVDVGDSPQYWEGWQNRTSSREVSIQEALELVKRVKQ